LNKTIELDSNIINAYFLRGCMNNSINDLNKVIEKDKEHSSAYIQRAEIYYNQKEFIKAYADFSKALNLKNVELVQNSKFYTIDKLKSLKASISECYFKRGRVNMKLNDYQNSIFDFEKSLKLDSLNESSYINIALNYEQLKE